MEDSQKEQPYTNALAKETSPYLLQHAHNPVNWLPWGDKALEKAKDEDLPILVSIGYSSCHWCHVMEKESFEDVEVARIMNENFVCVKVDREERPDVDQVYMEAVQMMRNQGGWPLNCFATSEGKPIYGGTYFPKENWKSVLQQIAKLWKNEREEVLEYGEKMEAGMQNSHSLPVVEKSDMPSLDAVKAGIAKVKERLDYTHGGPDKAPKFPLPVNYLFLMKYGSFFNDPEIENQVELTLDKMALGGIYDQIGGGFTRYSTDQMWKVPHFEKMLYDNAQLIGLYADGFAQFKSEEYLHILAGIDNWLKREMKDASGGYYSAIDADSEGEEGKFYTWSKNDIPKDYDSFYFIDHRAQWEGKLIPVRKEKLASKEWKKELDQLNSEMLKLRNKRPRPQTDDKILCSWNALLATGYFKAFRATGNDAYFKEGKSILDFITSRLHDVDTGTLSHSWKNGKGSEIGFLEDYAFVIEALLDGYACQFSESFLSLARALTLSAIDRFYDEQKGFFYFTEANQKDLISRPAELSDNVIPASNSVMAQNLHKLSAYFGLQHFNSMAMRLLNAVQKGIAEYSEGYANWANLQLTVSAGSPEVVITGPKALNYYRKICDLAPVNTLFAIATEPSDLNIFANRFNAGETKIFICQNRTCQKPTSNLDEAEKEIERIRLEIASL